jgi:DedD protein
MIDADDIQLQIKKRARRRLVGAVAFFAFAALVLPMVMDQEPVPVVQEVEIRIPGQDDQSFQPRVAPSPPDAVPPPVAPPAPRNVENAPSRIETRPEVKPEVKPEVRPGTSSAANVPSGNAVSNNAVSTNDAEARRAAAILAGRLPDVASAAPVATADGPHVILIGAFINESNVRNLKTRLGELGIKVYTEPLESPQGVKTRVRAGPFQNRRAAEAALKKMERIGVSGIVAAQ